MGNPQRRTPGRERRGNPGRRVLDRDALGRVDTERSGGRRGTARGGACRWLTSSPVTDATNDPSGAVRHHGVGEATPRHRDEHTRNAAAPTFGQQLAAPGPPRQLLGARGAITPSSSRSTISTGSSRTPPRSRSSLAASSRSNPIERLRVVVASRCRRTRRPARIRTRSSTARCRPACRPCPTAPPPICHGRSLPEQWVRQRARKTVILSSPIAVALLGVVDAQTLLGGEAQDAELAFGLVVVHGERRLADLVECVGRR